MPFPLDVPWERDKLTPVSNPTGLDPGVERRFLPLPTRSSRIGIALIGLGCAGLGAGVYGLWLAPEPIVRAGWFMAAGLIVGLLGLAQRSQEPPVVRVGALGITLGEPGEAQTVPWCDLQRIHVEASELRIETSRGPLQLSLEAHGRAVARIVAEAAQRIGSRLELSPRAHERLPALADTDGEIVPAARLQVAGRKCLASGTSITFESDAQLCEQCAALYHRQHVPAECKSCGRSLASSGSAARAAG
jgi:hypothetical protein